MPKNADAFFSVPRGCIPFTPLMVYLHLLSVYRNRGMPTSAKSEEGPVRCEALLPGDKGTPEEVRQILFAVPKRRGEVKTALTLKSV
jgi:hypothetical protein